MSSPTRSVGTFQSEYPAYQLSANATGLRVLSKQALDVKEIRITRYADTVFKPTRELAADPV